VFLLLFVARPRGTPLFPYTTLFRSQQNGEQCSEDREADGHDHSGGAGPRCSGPGRWGRGDRVEDVAIEARPRDDRGQCADDADHDQAERGEQQHGIDVLALGLEGRTEAGDQHRRGQHQHAQQSCSANRDELGDDPGQMGPLGLLVDRIAQRTYPSFLSTVCGNSSPARYRSNRRWNCSARRIRHPSVSPLICGVMMTSSKPHSGWSAGSGSSSNTSRPAPAISLPRRAATSASVSTVSPRPTLMNTAVSSMAANTSAPMSLSVRSVSGAMSMTQSYPPTWSATVDESMTSPKSASPPRAWEPAPVTSM